MNQFWPTLRAFVVALLATAFMAALRHFVFVPFFGFNPPALPYLLAILLAAWLGGSKSGFFATAINAVLLTFVFSGSIAFQLPLLPNQIRLLLFVVIGGSISWGIEALRASRQRLEERQRELENEVIERRNAESSERKQREQLGAEIQRREEAEAELREREERTRLAIDSAEIGTWDLNPLTEEITSSVRCKAAFGFPPEPEVNLTGYLGRVHSEDRESVQQAIQAALDPTGIGDFDIDFRAVSPDGTTRWVIAKGQTLFDGEMPNRQAVRFIGTVLDITDRKQAEARLRASDSRLQAIMDNTSAIIYIKDLQGRFLMINKRFEKLLNVDQQQFIGKTDADIFPSDVVATIHAHDRQVRETGRPLEFEEVVPHTHGPHTYVAVKFPITDANGTLVAIGGISTDITDRKAVEDVVRASEIRLRGILDNVPAVISLKDLEGRYVLVNRRWEELFGVTNEEVLGLTNYELLSKPRFRNLSRDIADQFFTIDRKVIRTGEPIAFEERLPSGNDQRIFATVKFPMKDASGKVTGVGGISIDVTERRKAMDSLAAEQDLLRHTIEFQDQERQLIAYEIHDGLVQYVTGALMQVEALRDFAIPKPAIEAIENIESTLRRAVAEGRHLMNGIRTPVLDNFGVVAAIEQLLDEEERAHVQVEFVKDDELERLEPKIEEALYRITQEALSNIGKHSQSKNVRIELGRRGDRVHLEVRDWGIGFTPAENSKGVHGLRGMAERARIAGGLCTIESAPGEGTRVIVDLPFLSKKESNASNCV